MSVRSITQFIWHNPGNRGKRIQKSFAAVRWQFLKRFRGSTRLLNLPNGVKFRAYPDCNISSALIYSDWPEYRELMFIRRLLRSCDVVIDIGANVGHFSLLLGDIVEPENMFAFEPAPIAFKRLVENWQLNHWPTEHLFPIALGSKAGTVYLHDINKPETTLSVSDHAKDESYVSVKVAPLDSFKGNWPEMPIGLIKIDVEGYEAEVFRGSKVILCQKRPHLIMFESLVGSVDEEIRGLLDAYSYKVFQLDSAGRPDIYRISNQNLFAVPEENWGYITNRSAPTETVQP